MRNRRVVVAGVVLAFWWMALPLAALPGGPKGDAYVGYSRTTANALYANVSGLNGWQAALHLKVGRPFLGIEGDISQYGLGTNSAVPRTTMFLVGPRVTAGAAGFHLFAHVLGGGEHSANSSGLSISGGSFAYAVGGGLDVRLIPYVAWRVTGDYLGAPSASPSGAAHARIGTGLVLRF